MAQKDSELESFNERLRNIELRLASLESAIALDNSGQLTRKQGGLQINEPLAAQAAINDEDKGLESRIGRVGLAWLGNIVLAVAVVFITEYFISAGYRLLPVILGVLSAGTIFLISNYLKHSNLNLSFMLKLNSQVILFYEALRLHFFSVNPLIQSKIAVLIILLLIVSYQVYLSVQNKSQTFGLLAVIFALLTAIVSDKTHFFLPLITLTAAVTVYFFFRYNWQSLILITILLVYIVFFMWLFSNPVMGHPMQMVSEHNYGHLYLFMLGGCFSVLPLLRKKDGNTDDFLIGAIILNGLFFTLILTLILSKFFSKNYVGLFSVITLCCLIYSIILKSASDWKFSPAFYALYGFLTMSISLYGLVGLPGVYLLLSVQSLVVVSMALWFSNRLMIVMNSLLFLSFLLIYLLSSKHIDSASFSFALVPLLSARIINWRKERLKIKTDIIRNLYLIEGFFMVLYALYHGLPKHFVTLSWIGAALVYFLLSFLLKNIKYRYMALGTMICATLYLFIVDLASIEIIYRVLALLFLSGASIGISIYYSNRIKKSNSPREAG
jgi:hypothetical protein